VRIKPLVLAIALVAPLSASANMQQQVGDMFGQLINMTGPGSYKTATRGVVSGGGVVIRNRITTGNLISITPPSAKGGCGGINLYTGSFSFINGEEFVALMRNIASNAVGVVSGYAFEAALEYMDAATAGVIRGLRNSIQRLNEMFSNSCQLASGIVEGGIAAFKERNDLKAATQSFAENVAPDFFSSKTATAESPSERLSAAGKMEACVNTGNIIWCALKKVGIASHVMFGSNENAEFIMSMTGTRLLHMKTTSDGGKDLGSDPLQPILADKALSLFVEGSENSDLKVYSCGDDVDQCLEPEVKTLGAFKGLKQRIIEDVRNSGVIDRFAIGQASEADGARIRYLATSGVGSNLFKVIQKSGAAAGMAYFEEFAHVIALNAAYGAITELLDVTYAGLSGVEFAESEVIKNDVRDARLRLNKEWTYELSNGTNFRDADKRAAEIMKMTTTEDQGKLLQGRLNSSAGN
jgi:conjugative transfer pilus assembly protein TraH